MTEKVIKTRTQQKHDIEANWNKATNFIPKAGEIIIYDPDATYAVARQKVGDGKTKVSELPFIGPTIGGATSEDSHLLGIVYTTEASIGSSPLVGAEYACTDLIDEADLDTPLQTKINSALTQTTADERYFQKTEAASTIPTNIQNGEPTASVKLTSNTVQGEFDSAFGSLNITSVKGYYIQSAYFSRGNNTTVFVLGTTQVNSIPKLTTRPTADTSFTAPEWDIGVEIAIAATFNFRILGTITAKENNLLTVSPDLTSANITDKNIVGNLWDNSICCPAAPTKGAVVLTAGSMATGAETVAAGPASHSEGHKTTAYSAYAHAEGMQTFAGYAAHAEGMQTKALGTGSHAEGKQTVASGFFSHAEGYKCTSSGQYSHAQGFENEALAEGEFVTGKYSKPGQNAVGDNVSGFLVRVGSGTSNTARSNCFTIDADETVSMKKAVISTDLISRPFSVINKEYADAHYAPIGGGAYTKAVSSNTTTHILPKNSTVILVGPSGTYATFDASSGMYKFTNYGTVFEMKASLFVTNGATQQHEYFFAPAYADTGGSTTTYYTPVYWYSEGTAAYCDADGTKNANGAFVKVTSKMHYVVKS